MQAVAWENDMILCIGEILADMFGKQSADGESFTFRAGGAPFNVACCIARLGGNAGFVGRVGADLIGDKLTEFACDCGLKEVRLQRDGSRNTTLAFVSLDQTGERNFCFYRKNTADSFIDFSDVEPLIKVADLVHIGSLMLSEPHGREFASRVANAVHKAGKLLGFDVNYREDIYPDAKVAAQISCEYIAKADIVKLSESEVSLLYGDMQSLRQTTGKNKTVCVTMGEKGSVCFYNGELYQADTVSVRPIDTTGAGDAFYGAFLLAREEGLSPQKALAFANVCGALTTTKKGAIEALPTREQIWKTMRGAE